MILWGIDLATRRTGWTAGVGDKRPEAGAFLYDHVGEDLGLLIDLFDADLCRLADRWPPGAIVYEAPLLMRWDKLLSLRKTYSMGGHLEFWARRRGVLIQEEDPKNLKRLLTGTSKAKKAEMVDMAVKLGISLPDGAGREDAADSFAAWLCCLHHHAKEFQPRWDRALFSPRGRLDL